jgi:hypothetical protein
MESGLLPDEGLCGCLNFNSDNALFHLITPTSQDLDNLKMQCLSSSYWAYGGGVMDRGYEKMFSFTELRQTIVLFLAAMNGEL